MIDKAISDDNLINSNLEGSNLVGKKLDGSPVNCVSFRGKDYFIKRDDLLDSAFSGNKARKLRYYLDKGFPAVKKIISYGSAQSNTLYALSELAKLRRWSLDFYVDHIPGFLKDCPAGNYLAALNNGANIINLSKVDFYSKSTDSFLSVADYIQEIILSKESHSIFIPEGGHSELAEYGLKQLADEITCWAQENNFLNIKVVLPSGTGTAALFLQKNLNFEVLTCPCVGDADYLKQQFLELSENKSDHPTIIPTKKKYH